MATTTPKAAKATAPATPTSGFDVRKTVTDAGYIAVGLGVLGVQQVQTRTHQLGSQLQQARTEVVTQAKARTESLKQLADKLPTQLSSTELQARLDEIKARLQEARERATEFGETTRGRVAPVVDQLETRVVELPAPLPRAAAPVVKAAKQLVAV